MAVAVVAFAWRQELERPDEGVRARAVLGFLAAGYEARFFAAARIRKPLRTGLLLLRAASTAVTSRR